MIVTVTGGARSGKSSFAEKFCMKQADSGLYIATAQAFDEEMRQRIELHRSQREGSGFRWTTVEEPLKLAGLLTGTAGTYGTSTSSGESGSIKALAPVVLVDCLTLWLTNVLLASESTEAGDGDISDAVELEIDRLVSAVAAYPGLLVMVTNEVGSGIVPEYPLGRIYRDYAGMLNRKMAEISDSVFLVTAGIPIELKSREYRL